MPFCIWKKNSLDYFKLLYFIKYTVYFMKYNNLKWKETGLSPAESNVDNLLSASRFPNSYNGIPLARWTLLFKLTRPILTKSEIFENPSKLLTYYIWRLSSLTRQTCNRIYLRATDFWDSLVLRRPITFLTKFLRDRRFPREKWAFCKGVPI